MDHDEIGHLYEAYPTEWALGAQAARDDLDKIRALTPAEAVAVAARHYSVGGHEAAAFWGGYAAGIVRYERGEIVRPDVHRAQLRAVKYEEIAAEVARGEHDEEVEYGGDGFGEYWDEREDDDG